MRFSIKMKETTNPVVPRHFDHVYLSSSLKIHLQHLEHSAIAFILIENWMWNCVSVSVRTGWRNHSHCTYIKLMTHDRSENGSHDRRQLNDNKRSIDRLRRKLLLSSMISNNPTTTTRRDAQHWMVYFSAVTNLFAGVSLSSDLTASVTLRVLWKSALLTDVT